MFSTVYQKEILKDHGVRTLTVDFANKTVDVQRTFIAGNAEGDPEKFLWRESVGADGRDRLIVHVGDETAAFLASLLWSEAF